MAAMETLNDSSVLRYLATGVSDADIRHDEWSRGLPPAVRDAILEDPEQHIQLLANRVYDACKAARNLTSREFRALYRCDVDSASSAATALDNAFVNRDGKRGVLSALRACVREKYGHDARAELGAHLRAFASTRLRAAATNVTEDVSASVPAPSASHRSNRTTSFVPVSSTAAEAETTTERAPEVTSHSHHNPTFVPSASPPYTRRSRDRGDTAVTTTRAQTRTSSPSPQREPALGDISASDVDESAVREAHRNAFLEGVRQCAYAKAVHMCNATRDPTTVATLGSMFEVGTRRGAALAERQFDALCEGFARMPGPSRIGAGMRCAPASLLCVNSHEWGDGDKDDDGE